MKRFSGLSSYELLQLFKDSDSIKVKQDMLDFVVIRVEQLEKSLKYLNKNNYTRRRFKILKDLQEYESLQQYFQENLFRVMPNGTQK